MIWVKKIKKILGYGIGTKKIIKYQDMVWVNKFNSILGYDMGKKK